MKRMSVAIVVLVLASSFVYGGGNQAAGRGPAVVDDGNFNPTGFPIVNQRITLTGFGNINVTHRDWNDVYCFVEWERKSNISIEWTQVPNQGFVERRNLLMASGDYPNFFYRCAFPIADIINFGSRGIFVPLNDLIENYGHSLKTRMQENPDMARAMRMPDGNIYTTPTSGGGAVGACDFNWINKRWLDNVGLPIPTTIQELERALIAFRDLDANGNGNPNDEIPYSCRGQGSSIFNAMYGAFGIGNLGRGQAGNYIDVGPDGNIRLFAISDNFRQMLEWLNRLYAQGLLDPEMFTQDIPAFTAKSEQDLIGAVFAVNTPEFIGQQHVHFVTTPPLVGPTGRASFNNTAPPFANLGAFAISNQNSHLRETIRWVEYWYSEEGAELKWLGQEGVTFTRAPDGTRRVTELITNNPQGLNAPQSIGQFAIGWAGGGTPIFATPEMDRARMSHVLYDSYDIVSPFMDLVALPILSFTPTEQQQLNPIISDMITYIDESRVQFVTGRRPLNQWDAYVRQVMQMGAERYVALQQASFNRFMGQ